MLFLPGEVHVDGESPTITGFLAVPRLGFVIGHSLYITHSSAQNLGRVVRQYFDAVPRIS